MTKHKDLLVAAAALAAVMAVLAVGFHQLGSRANQRAITADERRIADLRSIAQAMYYRNSRKSPLPASLTDVQQSPNVNIDDPVTKVRYEYHPKSGSAYELCATFATDNPTDEVGFGYRSAFWKHDKGRRCYQLDSSRVVDY